MRTKLQQLLLAAALVPAVGLPSVGRAADFTWNNTGTTLWSAGTWSGAGAFPNGASDNILTPAAYGRADLDGDYTVGNFTFGTSSSPVTASWQVVAQNTAALRKFEVTGALTLGPNAATSGIDLIFRNTTAGQLSLKLNSIDTAGRLFFGQNEGGPLTKLEVTGLTNITAGLLAVTSTDATFGEVRLSQAVPEVETIFRVNNYRTSSSNYGVTIAGLSGNGTVQGTNAAASQTVIGTLKINTLASTSYSYAGKFVDGIGAGTNRLVVVKTGDGVQEFSGSASTYSGGTIIQAGTLLVTNSAGSGLGVGAVSVANGGTLGGNGFIALGGSSSIIVAEGGTISPGTSTIGTLTLDGGTTSGAILSLASGSGFEFKLGAGNTSDQVAFWNYAGAQDFVLGGDVSIDFSGAQAGTYTLFSFFSDNGVTATASGILSGFNVASFTGLDGYDVSFDYGSSDITLTLSAVPEPGTIVLVAVGLLFLVVRKRVVA